jgi:hypothetical protein
VTYFRPGAVVLLMGAAMLGAQPVPDFRLRDVDTDSPRANALVSPRDYLLQVSGYYFGEAG